MKTLAWLLLAVFCTALVRVQPVELGLRKQCVCCHCKGPCECGMPCSRAPNPVPVSFATEQPARIAQAAVRGKIQPARLAEEKFFAPFIESAAPALALNGSAPTAPAANVPLFKAHCSFLI